MSVCCSLITAASVGRSGRNFARSSGGPIKRTWVVGFSKFPRGGGSTFQLEVAMVKLVELMCFLCHRKDNNDAYIYVAGCIQQLRIILKLLQFVCVMYSEARHKKTWHDSRKLHHFPEVGISLRSTRRLHHFPKVLITSALVFALLFAVETFFVFLCPAVTTNNCVRYIYDLIVN